MRVVAARVGALQAPAALWRASGAVASVAALVVLALQFFPGVVVFVIFVAWPGIVAFLLCGGHRPTYERNATFAVFASAATGAAWLLAAGQGEARMVALAVGAVISFVLLGLLAAAFAWALLAWLERRGFGRA